MPRAGAKSGLGVSSRGSVREQAAAIADTFDLNQDKPQLESSDQVPLAVAGAVTELGLLKKNMEFTGGCVCGGTRYVLKSRPSPPGDCHCIDCRRSAGAPYVTWGSVPREDLVVTKGGPRKIAHANRIRSFAACCGTHLFFEDTKDSETIDVTIASLDDPTPFAPQKAIWLEDKLPWITIDESLPSFPKSSQPS